MLDPSAAHRMLSKAQRRAIERMHLSTEFLMVNEMPAPQPTGMSLTMLAVRGAPLIERKWIHRQPAGTTPAGDGYGYRLSAHGRAVREWMDEHLATV